MTKSMFEIITTERLQSKSAIDWTPCYLCQKGDNIVLHFPHNKNGKCNLHIIKSLNIMKPFNAPWGWYTHQEDDISTKALVGYENHLGSLYWTELTHTLSSFFVGFHPERISTNYS